MKVPVSWLREYVAFDEPVEDVAASLVFTSCEVDRIVTPRRAGRGRQSRALSSSGASSRRGSTRTPTGSSSAAWTWASPSLARSSAAPGTSAPGRPWRSRCPGAVLPGGQRLERAKLRGETSDGMILSERELELGADHTGIMVLADGPEPGTPLADVLPLSEVVLEIETGYNRPDLTSVYGIAREVAALTGAELAPLPGREPERSGDEAVDVRDRGPRALPALHRPALPGRDGRRVAVLAQGATARRRHAADLERRRRDELRDARARQPAARVRLRDPGRGKDRRPPRRAGREHADAGRQRCASSTRTT